MNTPLIETMARAYRDADAGSFRLGDVLPTYYVSRAQAAINALTEAGYAIVPIEPTPEMVRAVDDEDSDKYVARGRAVSAYRAMIKAGRVR